MKYLISIIWLLIYSPITFSNVNHFKIAPYTVRADNGDIYLKFQLKKPTKLNVSSFRENDGNNTILNQDLEIQSNDLTTIRLGGQKCNDTMGYKISFLKKTKNLEVINRKVPGHKCNVNDEFTFGFISDTQQGKERHSRVAQVIEEHLNNTKLNFLLHTGDIVHYGGLVDEWLNYFTVAQSYLKGTPIVAAVGNHEYWKTTETSYVPNNFEKYMRWAGSQEFGYMTAVFPQFQLVIINSNFEKIGKGRNQQLRWVENTLMKAEFDGRPVIVAMHHPPFASSVMNGEPDQEILQNDYVPLFEKYGVKLVLNGHTHMYERSFKDGVHYIIAGPAGGSRAIPLGVNPYKVFSRFLSMTFSTVKVNHQNIEIKTWDEQNTLIDQLAIPLSN